MADPKDTKGAAPAASSAAAPAAAPQPEKRVYVVRFSRIVGTLDGKRDPRRGDPLRLTAAEAAALGPAVELSR